MLNGHLTEFFYWLQLIILKPIVLKAEIEQLSKKIKLIILIRFLIITIIFSLFVFVPSRIVVQEVSLPVPETTILVSFIYLFSFVCLFSWPFVGMFLGILLAFAFTLVNIAVLVTALLSGLLAQPEFDYSQGLMFWLSAGGSFGISSAIYSAVFFGLLSGLGTGLRTGRLPALAFGGCTGFFLAFFFFVFSAPPIAGILGLTPTSMSPFDVYFVSYWAAFLLTFFRALSLPSYAMKYYQAAHSDDPFRPFINSPVYWDHLMPYLPRLNHWLLRLVARDRDRGLAEARFVVECNLFQRPLTQRVLLNVAIRELKQLVSLEQLQEAERIMRFLPIESEHMPRGFADARRRIDAVAQSARDYFNRVTLAGQKQVLQELKNQLVELQNSLALLARPVSSSMQSLAGEWLALVKQEQTRREPEFSRASELNPFLAGSPLQARDHDLFKGRRDIIAAIEEHIVNPDRRPALFLYGKRRIGKTSTLLNLPHLLGSRYVTVFIDLQDAKWREGDDAFCYQVVRTLVREIRAQAKDLELREPRLEHFRKYPFSALDEALDHVEELSRQIGKRILLTLDEYERLEEGLTEAKLTTNVLHQIRTIVQHRDRIVVLLSGSHRFEELSAVNWSDYLINFKMLELGFLQPEEARELLTEPTSGFPYKYEDEAIDNILRVTHCQPYLIQAIASELFNILSSQGEDKAHADHVEQAIEKVLMAEESYFADIWKECLAEEKAALRVAASADGIITPTIPQTQKSVYSLLQRGVLEIVNGEYRFNIELFRRWIAKNYPNGEFPTL